MPEILTTGVTLNVDKLGTGVTWTKIPQVTSIDGVGGTTDSLEKTDYDSLVKEFRAGLHDPGEAGFEINFDPDDAEHKWIMGRPSSGATYDWRIEIPTSPKKTYIEFSGFVTAASPAFGAPGEIVTASCSIKITDVITWAMEP